MRLLVATLAALAALATASPAMAATTVVAPEARLQVSAPLQTGGPLRISWDLRHGVCAGADGEVPCRYAVVGTLAAACPAWEATGDLYRFNATGFASDTGLDVVLHGDGGRATVEVVDAGGAVVGAGTAASTDLAACPDTAGEVISLTGALEFSSTSVV